MKALLVVQVQLQRHSTVPKRRAAIQGSRKDRRLSLPSP